MESCDTKALLDFILLCGSVISDELFYASYANMELESSGVLLRGNIAHACQVPQVGGRFKGYAQPESYTHVSAG